MATSNTPDQQLAWEYLAHSEIGLVRKNNQDSGLVSPQLLLVADGMGGAAAGDLASAVAVDTIADAVRQAERRAEPEQSQDSGNASEPSPDAAVGSEQSSAAADDPLHRLAGAISAANTRIADLVATDYALEGMGTTVTAMALDGDGVALAHIGDSRAYLFRDGELSQLTHDHSWVQSLIDEGKITPDEAATHPHRSLLLKVLNGQPANEPDLTTVPLHPADRLLLCSDGLCGFVDDAAIADALRLGSREQAMEVLVGAAHQAGGLDNITILIADVNPAGATPAAAGVAAEAADGEGQHDEPRGDANQPSVDPTDGDQLQFLGAAAEADLTAYEAEIRERVAQREAEAEEYDGDDDDHGAAAGTGEDEDRYDPQPPGKRRWRRPLLLTLVVLILLGVVAGAGFAWTRTQYYVGAAADRVAIYQGLSQSVPGLPLSRVYEVQDLQLAELPAYYQSMVRETIDTQTLEDARATVRQLQDTAQRCAIQQQPAGPSPKPTASPTPKSKTSPTSGPKPKTSPKSKTGPTGKSTAKTDPKSKTSPTTKSTAKTSPKTSPKQGPAPEPGTATAAATPKAGTSTSPVPTGSAPLPGGQRC